MTENNLQMRIIHINTLNVNISFIFSITSLVYTSRVALYYLRFILSYNNNKSRDYLPGLPAVVTFCLLTTGWLNSDVTRQYESYFTLKTTPQITPLNRLIPEKLAKSKL